MSFFHCVLPHCSTHSSAPWGTGCEERLEEDPANPGGGEVLKRVEIVKLQVASAASWSSAVPRMLAGLCFLRVTMSSEHRVLFSSSNPNHLDVKKLFDLWSACSEPHRKPPAPSQPKHLILSGKKIVRTFAGEWTTPSFQSLYNSLPLPNSHHKILLINFCANPNKYLNDFIGFITSPTHRFWPVLSLSASRAVFYLKHLISL